MRGSSRSVVLHSPAFGLPHAVGTTSAEEPAGRGYVGYYWANAEPAAVNAVRDTLELSVDDVSEAVAARMDRQKVLRAGRHRFVYVVEEAVLHHRTCDVETHAGQLLHLLTAMSLPSVSLGIIPTDTPRPGVWPEEAFTMFDDELVAVELVSGVLNLTQPHEIGLYLKTFAALPSLTVHGEQARQLIRNAVDRLQNS